MTTNDIIQSLRDSAKQCDSASFRAAKIAKPAIPAVKSDGRYSLVRAQVGK